MEELYREVFDNVSRSVVVVENRNTGRYCIGSVVPSTEDANTTFILTSSSFISICNQIFVHTNDGATVAARKVVAKDRFILLAIDYTAGCSAFEFSQQDVDAPSEAIILAPTSLSSLSHIPAFVVQPSCAARDHNMIDIEGSEKYFMVKCHYGGLLSSHHNRLMSAPVFNLNGQAIGLVTSQCGMEKNKIDLKIGLLASSAKIALLELHEERKKQEPLAQSQGKKHDKAAETESSVGPSKKKRRLRKSSG